MKVAPGPAAPFFASIPVVAILLASTADQAVAQAACLSRWDTPVSFAAAGPHGTAAGDWNSDGIQDLAFVFTDGVRIVLGTGVTPLSSVSFGAPATIAVSGTPYSILAAKINDDAFLDLVTANNADGTIAVLLGNGDGTFAGPIKFPAGVHPYDLLAADLDADGRQDIVVSENDCATGGFNTLMALAPLVPGQPRFAASVNKPVGCNVTRISTADFNGDHRPDLALAVRGADRLQIVLGFGGVSFSPPITLTSGLFGVLEARAVDLDHDGIADLITAYPGNLLVFWGLGAGGVGNATFSPEVPLLSGPSSSVAVGDQDGDGDLDLACEVGGKLRLVVQSAPRTFTVTSDAVSMSGLVGPQMVDLNGDARADLVASVSGTNVVSVVPARCLTPSPVTPPDPDASGPGWDPQGKAIAAGGANQGSAVLVPDGGGGAFIVWVESLRVRAQHLSAGGQRLWNAGGIDLCSIAQDQIAPAAISDGSGGLYVAWLHDPGGSRRVRLLRMAASGVPAPGWSPCGIEVSTSAQNSTNAPPNLAPDGAGGVLVTDLETAGNGVAKAYRYTASGVSAAGWPAGGVQYASGTSGAGTNRTLSGTAIAPGGSGGLVAITSSNFFTIDPCCSSGSSSSIVSVSATGSLTSRGGVTASSAALSSLSSGQSVASYVGTDGSLHALALGSTGLTLWNSIVGPNASATLPRATTDGAGGAFLVWDANGPLGADLFGARLASNGAPAVGWAGGATTLLSQPGDQRELQLAYDGAGGIVIVWRDERSGDADVYLARIDGSGHAPPGWPADGMALVSIPGSQRTPRVVLADPVSAITVWEDLRNGTAQLYAQRVALDVPVAALASLEEVSTTSSSVHLVWRVSETNTEMRVERSVQEGEWSTLGAARASEPGRWTWDDASIMPGQRLGYRLVESGSVVPGSEVWVDVPRAFALGLRGFDPNPAAWSPSVSFTLPVAAPARIEIFDVSGRQRWSREVGSLGVGRHRIAIDGAGLVPGFYLLRLTQSGDIRTQRGTIVR